MGNHIESFIVQAWVIALLQSMIRHHLNQFKLLFLNVNDGKQFKAFDAYAPNRPKNHHVLLGGFGPGRSPAGETHWIIVGVNSFKEAMDIAGYRRGNTKEEKAWDAYIANNGGASVVRTGLRILLGNW